jgi:hypothetical protein
LCVIYWSVETLQSGLERTCPETGQPIETTLSELIGPMQTVSPTTVGTTIATHRSRAVDCCNRSAIASAKIVLPAPVTTFSTPLLPALNQASTHCCCQGCKSIPRVSSHRSGNPGLFSLAEDNCCSLGPSEAPRLLQKSIWSNCCNSNRSAGVRDSCVVKVSSHPLRRRTGHAAHNSTSEVALVGLGIASI